MKHTLSKRISTAPSTSDWERLIKKWDGPHKTPLIDILVPVYRGFEETMRCIFSVLDASAKIPYRLIVINDKSPDINLVDNLEFLAQKNLFELYSNEYNLGFVQTCNFGMKLHLERDIVLLNSDTEVFGDWLDRLCAAAYRNPRTATVTPLSNNAEICSYPYFVKDNWENLEISDSQIDLMAASVNAGKEVEIPTGVGFCMYIRRKCLNQIGLLDAETFGHGYGEENDLCIRAIRSGWRNILAVDIFVTHYGGASLGETKKTRVEAAIKTINTLYPDYSKGMADFASKDPVLIYRRNLDIARLSNNAQNKAVLLITHNWGGGTEQHVNDLADLLIKDGIPVFIGRPVPNEENKIDISSVLVKKTPNLSFIDTCDISIFVDFLKKLGISHIHIHHFIGFSEDFADFLRLACRYAKIPYDVTIHDYYTICPRIHLIDGSGVYCGEPEIKDCNSCITESSSPFGKANIFTWRDRYARFLTDARYIFVPDEDVANRMQRYIPNVSYTVRPHPVGDILPVNQKTFLPVKAKRRILLLGAIGEHKGSALFFKVAKIAEKNELPLEFIVVGYTDRDEALSNLSNVTITGRYKQNDLISIINSINADFAWFPAVCPETYSYTLSSVFAARIYPVAFDFGAISSRIRKKQWGDLMPLETMLSPQKIAYHLLELEVPNTKEFKEKEMKNTNYKKILESYYSSAPNF